jgi:hypothetical protein
MQPTNEAEAQIMRLRTIDEAGGHPAPGSAREVQHPEEPGERGRVLKENSDRIPMRMLLIFSALMDANRS